jgi:alcohol dehydrogenase class IV
MIDFALSFNVPSVPDRFAKIAEAIGIKPQTGEAFISWLKSWKKELGIPANLKEAKLKSDLIPKLSELAFQDSCHGNNPRICTQKDFEQIFTEAF